MILVLEAWRESALQLLHLIFDGVSHVECVGAREEEDRQSRRRLAVERAGLVILLRAEFDPADVTHVDNRVGRAALRAGLEDDVAELLLRFEPAERAHRQLKLLARGRRLLADLPSRDLDVLILDGVDDIHGRQIAGG